MAIPEPRQPVVAPVEMSTAEKLAAEWEARHDVVARRRHADPLVLQHYLAHARAEEIVRSGATATRRRPGATTTATSLATTGTAPAAGTASGDGTAGEPARAAEPAHRSPWWGRLFRGR